MLCGVSRKKQFHQIASNSEELSLLLRAIQDASAAYCGARLDVPLHLVHPGPLPPKLAFDLTAALDSGEALCACSEEVAALRANVRIGLTGADHHAPVTGWCLLLIAATPHGGSEPIIRMLHGVRRRMNCTLLPLTTASPAQDFRLERFVVS